MIKINMYGDGVRIWLCHVEDELYNRMNKARKQLPWELVLFDLDFLAHFGYQHWSELSTRKEQMGFYLTERNIIEIKQGNKKLAKFYANELLGNDSLFPLYTIVEKEIKHLNNSTFVLLEYETGLVMSYSIEGDNLLMDDLEFEVLPVKEEMVLSGLIYRSEQLVVCRTDTVMRSVEVVNQKDKENI